MWKKVLGGLVAVVAVLAVVVAMQPSDFRVERTVEINAPADAVFANVDNLKRWEAWSPWAKLDPQAKSSYEGPEAGVGASHSWAGNDKVGEGKMTVVESKTAELVKFRLDFLKPMAATHEAEFTFKADGAKTLVRWAMTGHNGFACKAFGLVMSMDKMIGKDFETGLAQLKAVTEAEAMARK